MREPEDLDADTARELLNQHAHEPEEEKVEIIWDNPHAEREDEPDTEAYRTYSLMLSHIWQSKRTDKEGAPQAERNAAWAANDQQKLDELAANASGLTQEEKDTADRLHAEWEENRGQGQ